MNIRLKAFLFCIVQFFIFAFLSFGLMLMFFHAALLATPIIAFMWTFFGFNVFTIITGVKIKRKLIVLFALLNFFVSAAVLFILITSSLDSGYDLLRNISIAVLIPAIGLYILLIVKTVKIYWGEIKSEFKRLFKRNDAA